MAKGESVSIAYKSQGAGAGTETNGAALNLACSATVDANDILVAHIMHTGTGTEPTTPTGWTLLYGPANVGTTATARHWAFGKIADGSEDGATVSFGTAGGTNGRAGRIYSFSGYISGTINQVIPSASFSSVPHATDPQGPSVTTTLVGALAVALTCQDDNNTEEAIAGASGGTWSGFQTFVSSTLGPQGLHLDIQVATPTANPGTISGGATVAVNDESGTIGFEIRPVGIPVTADFSPYHTVVDGSASGWDQYFENVSCVIKFGSTYFLYYIGGDDDADEGDDWVHNRQVGVATSPDMIHWTKYGSNPILSFTPEGDQPEEGIGDCKCAVYDGKVHMYYSALRWRSGGDVDVEIRYRVSTDGFTFTDDTLIIDDTDEELYSSGVYVDSGGTFHVYYAGPLTSGVGDLKKLSGSDPASLSSDGTITTNDYSSRGGIVPIDADNLLFFNDRNFDGSITCTLIKTSALSSLSTVFPSIGFNGGGAALDVPGCFFYEDGQWYEFSAVATSETAPFDATQIVMRTAPELPAFELAASANIAASAATATTAIMSAPGGKTTGDFVAGTISDDTNPLPSLDIGEDEYSEIELCFQATASAGPGVVYEFRVSDDGAALDSYTDLPEWTIEAEAEAYELEVTPASVAITTEPVTLMVHRIGSMVSAAVAVTPVDADLVKHVGLGVDPAGVTVASASPTLLAQYQLALDPAAVTVTPVDVALEASEAPSAYALSIDPASVSVAPVDVMALSHRIASLDPAAVALSAVASALLRHAVTMGDPTTIQVTTVSPSLRKHVDLVVDPVSVGATPVSPSLAAHYAISVDPASASLTMAALSMAAHYALDLEPETVAVTPVDVAVQHSETPSAYSLNLVSASVAVTPVDAAIAKHSLVSVDPSAVAVQMVSLSATRGYQLSIDPSAVSVTTVGVMMRGAFLIPCDPAQVAVTGIAAALTYSAAPTVGASVRPSASTLSVAGHTNPTLAMATHEEPTLTMATHTNATLTV